MTLVTVRIVDPTYRYRGHDAEVRHDDGGAQLCPFGQHGPRVGLFIEQGLIVAVTTLPDGQQVRHVLGELPNESRPS